MSRKNIQELLQREYDIYEEALRIEALFVDGKISFEYANGYYSDMPIEKVFNSHSFLSWELSDTFISVYEYRDFLNIPSYKIQNGNFGMPEFLIYLEYIINVIFHISIDKRYNKNNKTKKITSNINTIIDNFNYKKIIYNGIIILTENNPAATAVAELIEGDERSLDIIRYNHHALKGNLDEKRKILSQLYKDFEKVRPNIEDIVKIDSKHTLDSNLGELFNNTDIRHYKGTNPIMQTNFKKLSDDKKEEWYDKIYDLFLTSILANNYVELKEDIDLLKKEDA